MNLMNLQLSNILILVYICCKNSLNIVRLVDPHVSKIYETAGCEIKFPNSQIANHILKIVSRNDLLLKKLRRKIF